MNIQCDEISDYRGTPRQEHSMGGEKSKEPTYSVHSDGRDIVQSGFLYAFLEVHFIGITIIHHSENT